MSVSQQSILIQGRRAKYWIGGTGPTLVLLHGGLGDARQHWQATFDAWSPHFKILAPDLPGFGVSDPLPLPSYQAYLGWLTNLLEMLNIGGPVVLMGNSFGAGLSRLYTAENTSYVSRLILINGGQVADTSGCLRVLFRLPIVSALLFGLLRRLAYSRRGLKRAIHNPDHLTPEFVANAQAAGRGFVATLKSIGLNDAPALRTPTCPTLIVWGEADQLSPLDRGRHLTTEIPGARLSLIPQAAHMPQIEQPAVFHRTVQPFAVGR